MKLMRWTAIVCFGFAVTLQFGCGSSEPPLADVSDIGNSSTTPAVPQSTGVPGQSEANATNGNSTFPNSTGANSTIPSNPANNTFSNNTLPSNTNPVQTNPAHQTNLAQANSNTLGQGGVNQPITPIQPAQPRITIPPNAAPEQIISLFIGALKDGDDAGANLLFTQVAQKQLEQHEIPFGDYPNSQFQIAPGVIQGNQAQVQCNMVIEVEGQNYTVPGTWVLAAEAGQWRIRGMVTGNPGRFLDFEKPQDWVDELDDSGDRVAEQPQNTQPLDATLQR